MGKLLYFDCFSGISGDMAVGALLDLGINENDFLSELEKLKLDGYKIHIKNSIKKGITGTDFKVILEEHSHHVHRNLYDIEQIFDGSMLDDNIIQMSKNIFKYVAEAEAKIHGKSIKDVHFHEVGAVDSIVDIAGFSICMALLGVEELRASPLHVGTGFVECAHGWMPVPAPATLEILKDVPIYSAGIKGELVTPTGAAIIKALSQGYDEIPLMQVEKIGYGLGKNDFEIPNVCRVYLAEKKTPTIHS